MFELILASSSRYRRQMLEILGYKFTVQEPNLDETPAVGEPPLELVQRLAEQKAEIVAREHPNCVVIGSDQIGVLDRQILSKPKVRAKAITMLLQYPRRQVTFYSTVCVSAPGQRPRVETTSTLVTFRDFSRREAESYVDLDEPYDCAGAFKSEGRGVLLFETVRSDDPSALIGLPIIQLSKLLREVGINPLN